jgi:modulator of FtsH protease|tara:strand:- start:159 stop:818 length:660 start_codon:yes stop_codon:yes gene_type:complete
MNDQILQQNAQDSAIAINKVLTNTYFLLGLTLVWSAIVAGTTMVLQLPRVGFIITLVGFYGLLFMIEKNKESSLGLLFTFLLTGFMGYTLGPILNMYIGAGLEGAIVTALAGTALTFISCSAYALTTKRDLSFLGGMLTAGFFAIIAMMIANIFLQIPILGLAISGMFVLFSTAAILYTTQSIIRGGETNYISATVTLYVSIYNLFLSLLSILGVVNND